MPRMWRVFYASLIVNKAANDRTNRRTLQSTAPVLTPASFA